MWAVWTGLAFPDCSKGSFLLPQVKVGDTLDLLVGENKETGTEVVMRVLLKSVSEEKTESDKYRVLLRRWKNLKLPKKTTTASSK